MDGNHIKPKKKSVKDNRSSTNTLSKAITSKLLRHIIDGVYPSGSRLPTERQLVDEFGVTRIVIREALKRIEAMNLITIRQGSGSHVMDFETTCGIELADLLIYKSDGNIDRQFLNDVGQLHEGLHIWLVQIAAKRITPEELENLKKLIKERASLSKGDERLPGITLEITRSIVRASHNRYSQLLFNTLARTARVALIVFESPVYFDPEIQVFFERLAEAFEKRDHEMAALLVTRIFKANRENYLKAIGLMGKM